MNTKTVPIIITLAAAFISCVISIVQHVEFGVFVMRLFVTVAIFLVMGTIIKIILDNAFKVIEETPSIDDEVPDMGKLLDDEEGLEDEESTKDITLESEDEGQ